MRMILAATAFLALAGFAPATEVKDLAWLSGSWLSESADGWTEEVWTKPRAGVMLGMSRSGKQARPLDFEFIRIEADSAGRINYWAQPKGGAAVPFRLSSATANEAVFENRQQDYPQRIVYRRNGRELVATISLADGANPRSWTFRRD